MKLRRLLAMVLCTALLTPVCFAAKTPARGVTVNGATKTGTVDPGVRFTMTMPDTVGTIKVDMEIEDEFDGGTRTVRCEIPVARVGTYAECKLLSHLTLDVEKWKAREEERKQNPNLWPAMSFEGWPYLIPNEDGTQLEYELWSWPEIVNSTTFRFRHEVPGLYDCRFGSVELANILRYSPETAPDGETRYEWLNWPYLFDYGDENLLLILSEETISKMDFSRTYNEADIIALLKGEALEQMEKGLVLRMDDVSEAMTDNGPVYQYTLTNNTSVPINGDYALVSYCPRMIAWPYTGSAFLGQAYKFTVNLKPGESVKGTLKSTLGSLSTTKLIWVSFASRTEQTAFFEDEIFAMCSDPGADASYGYYPIDLFEDGVRWMKDTFGVTILPVE